MSLKPSFSRWSCAPKRGDVVLFKLHRDNSTDYIKRVIGLPGDHIEVHNGIVSINGQMASLCPAVRCPLDFTDEQKGGQGE